MSPHWNLSLQNIWDSSPSSQSLSHLSLREGLSLSERLLSGAIGVGYFGVAPAVADRKCLVKQGCGSWLLYLNYCIPLETNLWHVETYIPFIQSLL